MKKLISGMLFLGLIGFTFTSSIAQNDPDPPTLEEPCEDKVERQGALIVVTVCERKTSFLGGLIGMSCNAPSLESCTFTNVAP